MATASGRFVWYELMTTDLPAARAFYSKVVGWNAADSQMPDREYWMFSMGETPVAGAMTLPEEVRQMGAPPHWMGYVLVDDVEAAVAKATAAGGSVLVPPTEVPQMGRFAVLADPGGAAISVWQSAASGQEQVPAQDQPGRVGWNELWAGDLAKAFPFYAGLFGWEKKDAMDMGEMGIYQMFGTGDAMLGGMMTKPPNMPVAYWNYYINVGNIDEAAERVKAGGGQIMHGPEEVPGGDFVLHAMDPQGGSFALVGKR